MKNLHNLDPQLAKQIREVAAQCERKRRLSGLTRFGVFFLVSLYSSTALLYCLKATHWYLAVILVFLVSTAWALVRWIRPLLTPIDPERIALFIDEFYPELQNRMVTLFSLSEHYRGHDNSWVVQRFLKESQVFAAQFPLADSDRISFPGRWQEVRGLVIVIACLLVLPFSAYWLPSPMGGLSSGQAEYTVEPGDARVSTGEDLTVFVRSLVGPTSVHLEWRFDHQEWHDVAMEPGETEGVYAYTFSDLQQPTQYRIRFGSDLSEVFNLTPWLMPEVEGIDLRYTYPKYLQLATLDVPNGGDIHAVEGTIVSLTAYVNKPLDQLEMLFEEPGLEPVQFQRVNDTTWTGTVTVRLSSSYTLQPRDKQGETAKYQPSYRLSATKDLPPVIKVQFPYHDMDASPIDEIGFEFKVEDDYEIADFGIRYQVASKPPKELSLKQGALSNASITAYYKLMLETLNLSPGDLVTWQVWAKDLKPDRPENDTLTDPYFLEIRPFKRLFRQAVSDQNGQSPEGDPATRQKKVMIATWNLRKEAMAIDETTFSQRHKLISGEQEAILGTVEGPMAAMYANKSEYADLKKALGLAISELKSSSTHKKSYQPLSRAYEAQQICYQLFLKIAPQESQINRQRRDDSENPPEQQMAGMDDLELEKNRNFYEDEHRTQEQTEATAQSLSKIKDLAQRQNMVNEEMSKLISEQEQDALAEKELQRRLERLREEARKNLEQLDKAQAELNQKNLTPNTRQEIQNQLDKTRTQMNQQLEEVQNENLQQARSAGAQASENLESLKQHLEEQNKTSTKERFDMLQHQLSSLQERQQKLLDQSQKLAQEKVAPRLADLDKGPSERAQLQQDTKKLAEDYTSLLENASSLANTTQQDQEHLSRKLGDWLRKTSKQGIGESLEEASRFTELGLSDKAIDKHQQVAEKLSQVANSLDEVSKQQTDNNNEALEQALQELHALQQMAPGRQGTNKQQSLQELAETNYRPWLEHLRNAEGLLGEHEQRNELTKVRRGIEKIRKDYRDQKTLPDPATFENQVAGPLDQIITRLAQELTQKRENRQFILNDDGSIPEKYRKTVADYFEILTEAEGN